MKRSCRLFTVVLMGGVVSTAVPRASAQAPGQVVGEQVSAAFLEKRVPDELATEGIALSRQGFSLQVEQIGTRWLVSLVDLNTGRVVASTKIDTLPPDREAAVATMTHVVADLSSQVTGREPPPPVAPPPPAAPATDARQLLADERAEREARERAELKFQRCSLRFDATYQLLSDGNGNVALSRQWIVYQGALNQELAPKDFYLEVGRPDLYDQYRTRRNAKIGLFIASGALYLTSFVLFAEAVQTTHDCAILDFTCSDAEDKRNSDHLQTFGLAAVAVSLVGTTVGLIGFWYHFHPHPISENEAKTLADGYNQQLRRDLGLPVVSRREPLLREFRLAPYATPSMAGLGLSARF
jgi:hypothetical protein